MFKYFKAHFSVNLYQPLSKTAQKEKNMINATNRAKRRKELKTKHEVLLPKLFLIMQPTV